MATEREAIEEQPRDLRWAGSIAWAIIGILALVALALLLLYQIRAIFPPLVLALFVIFLLNPLVSRLESRGVSRLVGTLAIYLVFIALVIVVISMLAPPFGRQINELNDSLPELRKEISSFAESVAKRLGLDLDGASLAERFNEVQQQLFSEVGRVVQFTLDAIHIALIFVLAPIIALYLLIDLPKLQRSFVSYIPPAYKQEFLLLLEKSGQAIGGFFRGQLLVAVIVGFLSAVGLALIDIPFWLPIGLLVGFFNIIPFIGPFVGGGIAVIVGALSGGATPALFAGLVMLAVQQIDNHLISPNIMGRAVRLHPVTIILALLAGGAIAGLWGMLLSVPGTAVGKIWFLHFYSRHVLSGSPGDTSDESPADASDAAVAVSEPDEEPIDDATNEVMDDETKESVESSSVPEDSLEEIEETGQRLRRSHARGAR